MTPAEFFQTLKTHVDAQTPGGVSVQVGEAPDDTPAYVVIWPTPGTAVDDRTLDGRMGAEATDLSFQVTTVAPDPLGLLQITDNVVTALTDLSVGGRLVRPDVIANRAAQPLQDDTLRPVRHYMATTWQTQLTRSTTNV